MRNPSSYRGIAPVIGSMLLVGVVVTLFLGAGVVAFDLLDDGPNTELLESSSDIEINDDGEIRVIANPSIDEFKVKVDGETTQLNDAGETHQLDYGQNEVEIVARQDGEELMVTREEVYVLIRSAPNCEEHEYDEVDGTKLIQNEADLQCINAEPDSDYQLTNDINAAGTRYWNDRSGLEPITLDGTIDGNGYQVENVYIHRPQEDNVGTFRSVSGDVEQIGVIDAVIHGNENVGVLMGHAAAPESIKNVYATGTVSGHENVGGLIGYAQANGPIEHGYAATEISTTNSDANTGGVIADMTGAAPDTRGLYWDVSKSNEYDSEGNAEPLTTDEMTGQSAEDEMNELDFDSTWETTDSYPEITDIQPPEIPE